MASDPYLIAGGLNFGTVPSQNDYQGAYANALHLNQQNYANILAGYQGTLAAQQSDQAPIQQGYNDLTGSVLGDIQNIDASQLQAIEDTYQQQSGQATQGLTDRGLANTTVTNAVQRGLQLDKAKAQIASANQMAQLQAGYRSQLGSQALNYANQAAMQNAAQRNAQLQFMERVSAPYPNAKNYADAALQQQTLGLARAAASRAGAPGFLQGGHVDMGGAGFGIGFTTPEREKPVQQGGGMPYQTPPQQPQPRQPQPGNLQIGDAYSSDQDPSNYGDYAGNGQYWAGSGAVGSGNTQEDLYNAYTSGQLGNSNPAGIAGVAGVTGDGAPQQSTDLDAYNAWMSGNVTNGSGNNNVASGGTPQVFNLSSYVLGNMPQQQASLGQPGIANNLYDANGNPIAGVAGIAGTTSGGGGGGDTSSAGGWTSSGGDWGDTGTPAASISGDGSPDEENDYEYSGSFYY